MAKYIDPMNEVRRMLKKEMLKAGIKNFSVKGGTGTAWDWTDIAKKKNKTFDAKWTPKEQKILEQDFGYDVGHPSNSLLGKSHKIKSMLYGYKSRKFKKSSPYQKFKHDFKQAGSSAEDRGTCVLGAGTLVKRKGKPIDFIEQMGQGESKNWVAEKIMKKRAKQLGLELEHEGGVMD
tara:strand:+ start:49 stop:579 length:531 start_codon:yes stop_codon:yes gene_type:complete